MVFSAGNADGDGSAINTNRLANNPTPGLISVANYDDAEMGSRSNQLDDSSSRGLATNPGTWPDVSAPGTFLNFAAHDLSGNMSYTTGLDQATALDPAVYDTTTVGDTAGQAASWVRSQLPSGDLGGGNEIADSINNGQGLVCE